MRLEWTEPALADLTDIRHYISKDSPVYAKQFIQRIFEAGDKLAVYPHMGRKVPEAQDAVEEIRELLFRD